MVIKPALPPAELMRDCPITDVPIVTNGDMPRAIRQLRKDLRVCNADKAALREWAAKAQ